MASRTRKLKKNIEGFTDYLGIFHPIRSGNKEQGSLYDAGLAGDYDFPAERDERRARNQEKADQIYQERLLKESLDGALGDERKFSLSQFVRKSGGLKYDPTGRTNKGGKKDSWYGELAAFSFKECGRKGLAHKNGKYGVDGMREQANEAGYPNMQTESDFLDALAKDLRTGDIYPFFSADYMTNPTTPAIVWKQKAFEIGKAIAFFKKRKKTVKVNKLQKAKTIALQLAKKAEQKMKTSPKTKKTATAKKAKPAAKKTTAKKNPTRTASVQITLKDGRTDYDYVTLRDGQTLADKRRELQSFVEKAKKNPKLYQDYKDWKSFVLLLENPAKKAAKKTTAKKPATKKTAKKAVKKNGIIETAAAVAVGASAAVGLADRFVKGAKISNKRNVQGTAALKHNGNLKKNRSQSDVDFYEKEFERLLDLIEKGDTSKIRLAKSKGKLAGYSQNEVDILTHRARLTHRLQTNPAKINLADAHKLVHNGRLKQLWARGRAKAAYGRQLKLEAMLDRVKAKRAKAEAKAKRNPAKRQPTELERLNAQSTKLAKESVQKAQRALAKGLITKKQFDDTVALSKKLIADAKPKRNPATSAAVKKCKDAFYAFQGRFPGRTIEVDRPEDAPRHTWSVGKLIEIRLKGHPNLFFTGKRKNYYLAADMNSQQLWILGGSIASPDNSIKKGFSEMVGEITHLVYETHKAHLDNIPGQGYIHKLGEEGGKRPTLGRDRNGFPVIVGGDYTIEPLGIAN